MEYVLTPTAEHFDLEARRLASHPHNDTRTFPDGEVYVQLEDVDAIDHATVVHAGQPDPNRGLAYLYGLLDLLAERDCPTTLVFSYVPYCRQDRDFHGGTLNYARSLLRTVTDCYAVERVLAIDPHFSHRSWFRSFPIERLRAWPLIEARVEMDDYVVVGPDLGAVERFDVEGFEKSRHGAYDVELSGSLAVDGRNVLVFDDLVATGGTMVRAYRRLKEQGAATVQAAAVHGVIDDGVRRVSEIYDGFYLTNSVASDAATVSIEPLLEDAVG